MALLALRVHLNHFNAIIIMRLSNIIFKGFREEGEAASFPLLNHLRSRERAGEWLRRGQCGGRVTCNPAYLPRRHTPWV